MWYNSKKFWIFISSMIGIAGSVMAGEQTFAQAMPYVVTLILGYFGFEVADKKIPDRKVPDAVTVEKEKCDE